MLQETKAESEHINLKVLGQDSAVVQFKIKKHTPLRKLMNAYCDRVVSMFHLFLDSNEVTYNAWAMRDIILRLDAMYLIYVVYVVLSTLVVDE